MGENRREKQGSGGGFKRRSVYFSNLNFKAKLDLDGQTGRLLKFYHLTQGFFRILNAREALLNMLITLNVCETDYLKLDYKHLPFPT